MHASQPDPHAERTRQFRAIYHREFEFVWASARRFGVAPGAVDDAVQDVFLTAYRRLDHLRYEVSPRAWLYAVTRRVASHYRRGASRLARRVDALRAVPQAEETPQQRLDAAQQLERLMVQLGPANRAVFEMVELLGMSGPEVAAELGQPVNTVYSRLRLARARLQELIADGELAACIAAQREREAPPREASQRSWAIVAPLLGQRAASVGLLGWLGARAAVATTMVAVGGAVVIAVSRGEPEPRPESERPALEQPAVQGVAPMPAQEIAPVGDDGLTREVELVDGARARLADAPEQALALLAAHAREFPNGALADAREATRAEALCRRGEVAAAESVAHELLARHPNSSIARRLANFRCDVDGPPGQPGK